MVKQIFVKPNDGKTVRLENGMLLPREGMEVSRSTYIDRRILAEDIVVVKHPVEKKESKSK